MLRAVIAEEALDVRHAANTPDVADEQRQSHHALDEVDGNRLPGQPQRALDPVGDERWQDKEQQHRQRQREGDQRPLHRPFENLLRATVGAGLALFLHSHLGGEQQALDTQPHGVPQECQAAQEGNARQPAAVDARV